MRHLTLILAYLRHNLLSAMAYRGAFLLQVMGMVLNNSFFLFFWWVFFQRIPTLQGWGLSDVMILFGLVAFAFGIATAVFGNCLRIPRLVVTGQLDYYLTLPADPLVHLLVSRMSLSAWGDVLFGLGLFCVIHPLDPLRLLIFVSVGLLSAAVLVSFGVLSGSLVFWLGSMEQGAEQIIWSITTFSMYPTELFPPAIRVILYTLIPAAFVGALPARLVAQFSWDRLGLLLAFTVGFALLARLVFYRGLRRYSSGNLVAMRG
ncbi:ABC-2 family transporter protein [Candidatus Fermentibacteria bacterium]|nr:ABC-2 family transporter protein [Candidatus Fermentibacteria bacterium]